MAAADACMIGRLIERDPDQPRWASRQHGKPRDRARRAVKRSERHQVLTFVRRFNDTP